MPGNEFLSIKESILNQMIDIIQSKSSKEFEVELSHDDYYALDYCQTANFDAKRPTNNYKKITGNIVKRYKKDDTERHEYFVVLSQLQYL